MRKPVRRLFVVLCCLATFPACGGDKPPLADVRFPDPTCDGIARTFGTELDRRSLAALEGVDRERNTTKTMDEIDRIRLGLINAAVGRLAAEGIDNCRADNFLATAEAQLSDRFRREVPFWLTATPEEPTDYAFWRSQTLTILVRSIPASAPTSSAS